MEQSRGRVTIPIEENMDDELKKLIELWKADAVRNSDGTNLSKELSKCVDKVYSTFFPVRQDLEWAQRHPDQLQEMYLLSKPVHSASDTLTITLLSGYFSEQLKVDFEHDPYIWWEVIDRSTKKLVPTTSWDYDEKNGTVTIHDCEKFHIYTVSYLAWQTWDPTQMYNHIVNDWGDTVPHALPYNPVKPETHKRMLEFYRQWLIENPDPNVIRFTTFFYHFTLVFGSNKKEKYVDWFGYGQSISPEILLAFEKEKGYRLRPEHLVDEGYFNNAFRVPTPEYLDYIDFVQRFVSKTAKELVDISHENGREAMMFLGDNYIGTEPYGKYFAEIGLDSVVGCVASGATMRMIADIPHVKYTEGRYLPYFFPDTFNETGDPLGELNEYWTQSRRAMLRNSVDRIGYGGYPSLALKFPDFISRVTEVCDEFRKMYDTIQKSKPHSPKFKVAVLNCWGKLRTWQTYMVIHSKQFKQTTAYLGLLEALSGLALDVEFISFDDIANGVPEDIGVIINAGHAYTAFTGGEKWIDPRTCGVIREWVSNGGGFIGIGEPTACRFSGRYFQLADVLGVDKEVCVTLNYDKYNTLSEKPHFITDDNFSGFDFGEYCDDVYAFEADNLSMVGECTAVAANDFGNGRSVYLAGLPYSEQNTRLLYRSIFWAASKEDEMNCWFSSNFHTECSAYPARKKYAVVNNTNAAQNTTVYKDDGTSFELMLLPMELKWFDM